MTHRPTPRIFLPLAVFVVHACTPNDPPGDSASATDSSGDGPSTGPASATTSTGTTTNIPTTGDSAAASDSSSGSVEPTTAADTSTTSTTTGPSDTSSGSDTASTLDTTGNADTTSDTGAIVDETPPAVELLRPSSGIYVTTRRVVIVGQASDDVGVQTVEVTVGAEPALALQVEPGPAVEFTADIRLQRGWNTIEFTARDAADNTTSVQHHVHLGTPVAAGGAHTLALTDGGAFGFGRNNEGQLGAGSFVDQAAPVALVGLDTAVSVSANLNHSLAIGDDGTVLAWGRNDEAQLGLGAGPDLHTPTAVLGVPEAVLVAAGQRHSLVLTQDGQVWSWGLNNAGQLGRVGDPSLPGIVEGLEDVVAIAAGGTYSLAVDGTGAVWTWGNNTDGQLGDGTTENSLTPKPVDGLTSSAGAAGRSHSLVLTPLGDMTAWGHNASGQLGLALPESPVVLPTDVTPFADALVVAASGNLSLTLTSHGALWAFGQNFNGQLGLGDTVDRNEPTLVPDIPPLRAVAAGLAHSIARDADGAIWTWGLNSFGQLGKGDQGIQTSSSVPVAVLP